MGLQVLMDGGTKKNRIMEIVKAIRVKSGCFFFAINEENNISGGDNNVRNHK